MKTRTCLVVPLVIPLVIINLLVTVGCRRTATPRPETPPITAAPPPELSHVQGGATPVTQAKYFKGSIGNSLDLYPGKDREHGIIIVQSGTSTSRRGRAREREKNSLNLIRVGEERIRITHYMYFDDLLGFAPISRHLFPRPGRRFITC